MSLYKAVKVARIKKGVLIEISGTKTPQELMQVKDVLQRE